MGGVVGREGRHGRKDEGIGGRKRTTRRQKAAWEKAGGERKEKVR